MQTPLTRAPLRCGTFLLLGGLFALGTLGCNVAEVGSRQLTDGKSPIETLPQPGVLPQREDGGTDADAGHVDDAGTFPVSASDAGNVDAGTVVDAGVADAGNQGDGQGNNGAVAPTLDSPPTITHADVATAPTVGMVLTGDRGTWTGNPTPTFDQQWQRCNPAGNGCVVIIGATGTTYTVTTLDKGATLRFEVHASNSAGTVIASSAATDKVP